MRSKYGQRYLRNAPPPRKFPVLRIVVGLCLLWFGWNYWQNQKEAKASIALQNNTKVSSITESKSAPSKLPQEIKLRNGWRQISFLLGDTGNSLELTGNQAFDNPAQNWAKTLYGLGQKGGELAMVIDSLANPQLIRWSKAEKTLMVVAVAKQGKGSHFPLWLEWNSGCRFPGPCPINPLEGAALMAGEEQFDFNEREDLLHQDEFRGLGESPVVAILDGIVEDLGPEPGGKWKVSLYHGANLWGIYSGLAVLSSGLHKGLHLSQGQMLGRLAPVDSSGFRLALRRHGKFLRWNDFQKEVRPMNDQAFSTFLANLGI